MKHEAHLRTGIIGTARKDNPDVIDVQIIAQRAPHIDTSKTLPQALAENPSGMEVFTVSVSKEAYDGAMKTGDAVAAALHSGGHIVEGHGNTQGENAKTAVPIALFKVAAQGVGMQQFEPGQPGFDTLVHTAAAHQAEPHQTLSANLENAALAFDREHAQKRHHTGDHPQKNWVQAVKNEGAHLPVGGGLAV